jgi:hypothetical protein
MAYAWRRRDANGRYDANLRSALELARGRYAFLLGNDDALATPSSLGQAHAALSAYPGAGVGVANFEEFDGGAVQRRVLADGRLGAGAAAALRYFRIFSFVGGVILDAPRARALATDAWDGSEMYQMYLGCRLLAEGSALVGIARPLVRKGIRLPEESVESYETKREAPGAFRERPLPLNDLGRLVCAAAAPAGSRGDAAALRVFGQIYTFTYPYWLFEYRRIRSWSFAAGVAAAMRPRRTLRGLRVGWIARGLLAGLYTAVTAASLLLPQGVFFGCRRFLYALVRPGRFAGKAAAS